MSAEGNVTDASSLVSSATEVRYGRFQLRSAFQPIFSLSHQRLVGHEALLRATDVNGKNVSPQAMFQSCGTNDELRRLDTACRSMHARSFSRSAPGAQWLFLNIDASLFQDDQRPARAVHSLFETAALASMSPNQIVVELLEAALPVGSELDTCTEDLKKAGFLVALDDFGAGHSNFDRVFRLRPHIVKLDRSVIVRAAGNKTVRRVAIQMISLLHECGSLVLVEGVENALEANIALDADADFVQGYFFGRPEFVLRDRDLPSREMAQVWDQCEERAGVEVRAYRERVRPYAEALLRASAELKSGCSMATACALFLALADASVCYLLDIEGSQVGQNVLAPALGSQTPATAQFAPLLDSRGSRWSRRPYFRRAVDTPDQLQVTRPYPTMQSHRMCITLSLCFEIAGHKVVVCGDVIWQADVSRPGFSMTTFDALL